MFEPIYVGQTGLLTFSRNLTVIGNNVSNMNTTGFKSTQLSFSELTYRALFSDRNDGVGADLQLGSGVGTGGTRVLFTQGSSRDTGNPSDLAVDGNGFFVLRGEAGTLYTRNGEFEFDQQGFLTARANGARVAAFSGGGLVDLSIASLRSTPARATSTVRLVDNLSSGDSAHDATVTVFDSAGGAAPLTLSFTNNSSAVPRSWLFQVKDQAGSVLSSGEVRFNGDGSPANGFSRHTFTLAPPGGVPPSSITLDFGEPGSFAGATNFSAGTDSTLRIGSQDGFAAGTLVSAAFEADGTVVATYSNGRTARGPRVALAFFASPQELAPAGAALFENRTGQEAQIGAPREGIFGTLRGGALESANVDLASQFSELIVTQRGYQASSQVITTANEMMEQLFQIAGRR
jgi:flagellar hook protein FlgE